MVTDLVSYMMIFLGGILFFTFFFFFCFVCSFYYSYILFSSYFGTGGCVGSVIPVGTWAFYALTYNGKGGTGILYEGIGGSISSLSGTYPLGTSSIPANPTVYIGNSYPNYYWFGSIDDVRIYNRALSAAEIQALYAGGK